MMGGVSLQTSPKNIIIQDMINSEDSMNATESTNTNTFKDNLVEVTTGTIIGALPFPFLQLLHHQHTLFQKRMPNYVPISAPQNHVS